MKWLYVIGAVISGLLMASMGIAVGVNFNPESTVRFVLIWGDSAAWTVWGTWVGAVGTILAVTLALYYSRHDDKEKLTLISEVHDIKDGVSDVRPMMTLRVVCTGRLPTTILAIGFGSASDSASFYPVARYTTRYETRKHLSRGEVFEASLDLNAINQVCSDFLPIVGENSGELRFVVRTGLKLYREKLSLEARNVLSLGLDNV